MVYWQSPLTVLFTRGFLHGELATSLSCWYDGFWLASRFVYFSWFITLILEGAKNVRGEIHNLFWYGIHCNVKWHTVMFLNALQYYGIWCIYIYISRYIDYIYGCIWLVMIFTSQKKNRPAYFSRGFHRWKDNWSGFWDWWRGMEWWWWWCWIFSHGSHKYMKVPDCKYETELESCDPNFHKNRIF